MTPSEDNALGGVILAGGRSIRFGDRDKAIAPIAGQPMILRVASRLNDVVDELVVNCRSDQREAIVSAFCEAEIDFSFAIDETPDRGPMAGILAGLSGLDRAGSAMVIACDMPFLDPDVVRLLFSQLGEADAAVPRIEGEWLETTHAVYRREPMIRACRAALADGERRIVRALDRLEVRVVEAEEIAEHGSLTSFHNINTQEELIAAEGRIREDDG